MVTAFPVLRRGDRCRCHGIRVSGANGRVDAYAYDGLQTSVAVDEAGQDAITTTPSHPAQNKCPAFSAFVFK
jgi:hypothetical protein